MPAVPDAKSWPVCGCTEPWASLSPRHPRGGGLPTFAIPPHAEAERERGFLSRSTQWARETTELLDYWKQHWKKMLGDPVGKARRLQNQERRIPDVWS